MKGGALVLAVVLGVGTAAAQPAKAPQPRETPQPSEAPKPWSANVSEAEQELALSIYRAGNAEFEESRYAQALAKYREAIRHWDHPAIRFNMVVCLINLDQPLEAFDDLELALAYGNAPLGGELYAQGLTYQKLLLGQLAKVEVVSREPGAEVTLDGRKLFTGVGDVTRLVRPGNHQIVATKPGFLTATIPLVLMPGKVTVASVKLVPLTSATRLVRRWPSWKPWALIGLGAAVAVIGVPLELQAAANFDAYDKEFGTTCPSGCGGPGQPMAAASLASLRQTARTQNVAAISLFAVGGATLLAGIVGVILNQPRASTPHESTLRVVPVIEPGAASVVIDGRF